METLLLKTSDLNFQYDFIIRHCLPVALFHIMNIVIHLIEVLWRDLEIILHHIQTMSMLPWRRYAFRWAPTSRMWMHC